jgi:exodeoxyribonuclease III
MPQILKIASWNINSVRARIDLVTRFLQEEAPDILCLQETKVTDDIFPGGVFRQMGYNHHILHGQPMHHGVAIISKVPMREDDRLDWQANKEARHVGVRLDNGVRLENVYVPAGGEVPDREQNPKFGQKLDFLERMIAWAEKLETPTILTGDFNIAPMECDVWSHKQLVDVVSHTPVECELLGGCRRRITGSISAANSIPRRSGSTHGGAIAPRTGRLRIAGAGSIICGSARSWRTRRGTIASRRIAAAGCAPLTTHHSLPSSPSDERAGGRTRSRQGDRRAEAWLAGRGHGGY